MRPAALFAILGVLAALSGGCVRKPGPEPAAPNDPASTSDLPRFQGVWGFELVDTGPTEKSANLKRGEVDPEAEQVRQDRMRFEENRLTITRQGRESRFTFTTNEATLPKVMTVTEVHDDGKPPRTREWIYMFAGDLLIVALGEGDPGERPTDFVARAPKLEGGRTVDPGVTVITVRRLEGSPKK